MGQALSAERLTELEYENRQPQLTLSGSNLRPAC